LAELSMNSLFMTEAGRVIEGWRIQRHILMSGGLLTEAVANYSGLRASREKLKRVDKRHSKQLQRLLSKPSPLPGAVRGEGKESSMVSQPGD